MINKERAKVGAEPLVLDEALNETALIKAKDMAEYDAFSHESERLGNLTDQLKSIGYEYSCCGENIAMNQTTVSWVMNAWMNSDGHRENILNKLQNNRYRAL